MHPRDLASLTGEETIFGGFAAEKLTRLQSELEPLSRRYDVVVANPPYMGSSNMNSWLSNWVKERFPDSKRDLCTCFIERGFEMLTKNGYSAMVTMESWMFLSSFERMRKNILHNHCIATMVYMNHMVMRIAFNTCATVFANHHSDSPGLYTKVEYQDLTEDGIPFEFPVKKHGPKHEKGALEALANPDCGWFYRAEASGFELIPGSPIAYWLSEKAFAVFERGRPLSSVIEARQGLTSGDNDTFMRLWHEISLCKSTLRDYQNAKWFPCDKGGNYRKWYGNNEWVIDWENNGAKLKAFKGSTLRNSEYYLRQSFSWSDVSSGNIHLRYKPAGFIFEHCADSIFSDWSALLLFGSFLNSTTAKHFLSVLAPTMKFEVGQVRAVPILFNDPPGNLENLASENIEISKCDWDSFEISWGFKHHPLI